MTIFLIFLALNLENIRHVGIPQKQKSTEDVKQIEIRSPIIKEVPPHRHFPEDSPLEHLQVITARYTIGEDLWYIGYSDIKFLNAPIQILHHADLLNPGLEDRCPRRQSISVLGPQTIFRGTEFLLPYPGYGIYLTKGASLNFQTVVHNATDKSYNDVMLSARLHVIPAKDAKGPMRKVAIYRIRLSDEPCDVTFSVPPNSSRFVKKSQDTNPGSFLVFLQDGEILKIGAHLHYPDGKKLEMFLNGDKLFDFLPVELPTDYSNNYQDRRWTIYPIEGKPSVRKVRAGDRISIAAHYENQSDAPIGDAMGHLYISFSPDNEESLVHEK